MEDTLLEWQSSCRASEEGSDYWRTSPRHAVDASSSVCRSQRPNILVTQLDELMKRLIDEGRSVPGPAQANDVLVRWKSLR